MLTIVSILSCRHVSFCLIRSTTKEAKALNWGLWSSSPNNSMENFFKESPSSQTQSLINWEKLKWILDTISSWVNNFMNGKKVILNHTVNQNSILYLYTYWCTINWNHANVFYINFHSYLPWACRIGIYRYQHHLTNTFT